MKWRVYCYGVFKVVNEIQIKINRVNLTRLRDCVLKDETIHICLAVWGSHIPKFEVNC